MNSGCQSRFEQLTHRRSLFIGIGRPVSVSCKRILCFGILLWIATTGLVAAETDTAPGDAAELLGKLGSQTSLKAVRALSSRVDALPDSREKGQMLAFRASLEFLAGNYERSARLWLDAHSCTADDSFLLDAVRALVLVGECDAARAQLERITARGRDPHSLREARFLLSQLALFEGKKDAALLPKDLAQALPHRMASWHFTDMMCGGEGKDVLSREYRQSPEYYVLFKKNRVSLFPHPLWYLRSNTLSAVE